MTIASIRHASRFGDMDAIHRARVQPPPVRRKIGPEAGRALEILGHSIDYLVDECAHRGLLASPGDSEAIQLLMALNRQIYFACPCVPPCGARMARAFRVLFGLERHDVGLRGTSH